RCPAERAARASRKVFRTFPLQENPVMRKMLGTWTTMALFVGLIAPAFAADEEITLRGELIDTSCYTKQGFEKGTGAAHVTCAKDCAKKGQPLGILTDGDGVFKITGEYTENNNAKLLDYV